MNADYYNKNVQKYKDKTENLDLHEFYNMFLKYVPLGGKILDAGGGPGRDLHYFLTNGYDTHYFDASEAMVKEAQRRNGSKNVVQDTFHNYDGDKDFDGIWAMASMLHVPYDEISTAVTNMVSHLKKDGVMYISFKHGSDTSTRVFSQRTFTDMNIEEFTNLVKGTGARILESNLSSDAKIDTDYQWLNLILIKN